jgi:ubiquitin-conjugating enzyme E2 O
LTPRGFTELCVRPGDHVLWKNEEERQAGVVQSINAQERTALVLLADGRTQLVPVLELDVHGTDSALGDPQAGYGVRRGDLVFIHREGTTNGCEMPLVPSIGELEAWVHEHIVDEHGELGGWQKEMDAIGQKIAHARGKEAVVQGEVVTSRTDSSLNWFGEVAHVSIAG